MNEREIQEYAAYMMQTDNLSFFQTKQSKMIWKLEALVLQVLCENAARMRLNYFNMIWKAKVPPKIQLLLGHWLMEINTANVIK